MDRPFGLHRLDTVRMDALETVGGIYGKVEQEFSKFQKLIVEFIGTYYLVLTVGMVKAEGTAVGAAGPLAIGSALMVCVFAGGHISGGHYNPAVTFGILLAGRDKINTRLAAQYVGVQLFAGMCAAVTYWLLTDVAFAQFPQGSTPGQAFFCECIFTGLLMYVILNTATTKSLEGNSFYGMAIGFTLFTGAVAVGDVSGGVFNPAVGFGPIIMNAIVHGKENFSSIWIYFLAPLFGSAVAVATFRITNPTEYSPPARGRSSSQDANQETVPSDRDFHSEPPM
eukprot:gb/GEZN01007533.1/.p1 GENE.gb/GEZN01007533.1/~~gb/GEZN01007533.1/.p1  ORF type:complete len:282 (-),score=27.15 gb/GEZN01007533.1/:635-1480(-)